MKKYVLTVFNTLTKKWEEVCVSEEVYNAYRRTLWNSKDNDKSFFAHEIQFSQLKGGDHQAFENFHEFHSEKSPEQEVIRKLEIDTLKNALDKLTEEEHKLIESLYFQGKTERQYAKETGIPQKTINDRKRRILVKIKKLLGF